MWETEAEIFLSLARPSWPLYVAHHIAATAGFPGPIPALLHIAAHFLGSHPAPSNFDTYKLIHERRYNFNIGTLLLFFPSIVLEHFVSGCEH